jgi:hypothetical protein
MKAQSIISILVATTMALASATVFAQGRGGQGGASAPQRAQVERGQRDFDRDRMRDRDRVNNPAQDRKRDRDQDRTNAPDHAPQGENGIYGSELMSVQERNQYREQLRLTESDPKAQTKLKAEHKEKMQQRAREQGKTIKDPPKTEKTDS